MKTTTLLILAGTHQLQEATSATLHATLQPPSGIDSLGEGTTLGPWM